LTLLLDEGRDFSPFRGTCEGRAKSDYLRA
jgi:hypothetical protein